MREIRISSNLLEPFQKRADILLVLALAAGALLLGGLSGILGASLSPILFVMALGGLGVIALAFSRPEFIILLMLVISSTVLDPNSIPTIGIGVRFSAAELILILLLGMVAARALAQRADGLVRTPLDWPVLAFFVVSTLSMVNAIVNLGAERGLLVPIWRVLFNYLVFFAVTNLIRTRKQLMTLTSGLLVITTATAAVMILQGFIGPNVQILPGIRVGAAEAIDSEFSSVARVLPPGVALVFVMLFPVLLLHADSALSETHRWRFIVPLVLLPPAIALTFNRTWWLGTALSLLLLVFLATGRQRRRLAATFIVLAVAFLVVAWLVSMYVPTINEVFDALIARVGSFFADENTLREDQSRRLCEVQSATQKIMQYPLLGVGPGGVIHTDMCTERLPRYVHNAYLYILADLGILGMVFFLWFSAQYLYRGFFAGRTLSDASLRSWVIGLTLGFVAVAVASMAGPEFMSWHTTPIVGVLLGINEVAIRLDRDRE